MKSKQQIEQEHRIVKWTNIRRMTWLCLMATVVVTFSMLFVVDESRIEKLSDLMGWFFITQSTIISAYFGVTTYLDKK